MNIFVILLVWLFMGAVLVGGVILAVKGVFWLLILGLACFVAGIIKYGILSH